MAPTLPQLSMNRSTTQLNTAHLETTFKQMSMALSPITSTAQAKLSALLMNLLICNGELVQLPLLDQIILSTVRGSLIPDQLLVWLRIGEINILELKFITALSLFITKAQIKSLTNQSISLMLKKVFPCTMNGSLPKLPIMCSIKMVSMSFLKCSESTTSPIFLNSWAEVEIWSIIIS